MRGRRRIGEGPEGCYLRGFEHRVDDHVDVLVLRDVQRLVTSQGREKGKEENKKELEDAESKEDIYIFQ